MLSTIQQRITALREERGLSRKAVAEAIGEHYTSYCHYEDGSMDIKVPVLIKLASYYNVSADWIAGLDLTEKNTPPESKWSALRSIIESLPEQEVKELQSYVRYLVWRVQERERNQK